MMVLIAYDVSTETEGGKRRLQKVAKNRVGPFYYAINS